MKTLLYVDGFNLYYSAVKGTPLRRLTPVELAVDLLRPALRNQIQIELPMAHHLPRCELFYFSKFYFVAEYAA